MIAAHRHKDEGQFSLPLPLQMTCTVGENEILDGAVLLPGKQREWFETSQKAKYVKVGMQMRYYGDLVTVDAIDADSHPTAYVIHHDGSEKRTILEKLQFI